MHRVVNAEVKQPRSDIGAFFSLFIQFRAFPLYKQTKDRQNFNANLSSKLTNTLQTILTHTASERGRAVVPLITNSTGVSPFPFKIHVKVAGAEQG